MGRIAAGLSVVLVAASSAGGSVVHQQGSPPGVTGCERQPTISNDYPAAALPAHMTFRPGTVAVAMQLQRPTQATRATVRAYLPGGRRADAATANQYTCTSPAAQNRLAFAVKPNTVGRAIRRHGHVNLRVVLKMTNATGKTTRLSGTVLVTSE